MRATSMTARLFAATAICTLSSAPALAQDYGLQSTDSTPVSNPSGSTLEGAKSGVLSTGSALNLDNAGTIRGDGPNGSVFNSDGGIIISGGPANITNSGDISGARFGISTIYFTNPDNSTVGLAIGSTVDNSGSIIGENDDGIRLIGGGNVTNSGYIAGRTSAGADGISMFAYNGQNTTGMTSIGSVTNLAGGLIQGNRYGVVLFGGGTVDNAGTIDHTVNIAGSPLLGAGQFGIVNNSGTIINGGIAMGVLDSGSVDNSGQTPTIGFAGVSNATVNNSGTVTYFTSFDTANTATVNNSGSIGEGLIFNRTTTANVTNSGSITATNTPDVVGTTQDAVYSSAALSLTNTSTGVINGFRDGIRSDGASLTLDNAGTIRGNGDQSFRANSAGGVVLQGGPGFITNSGLISGQQFGITTIYVTSDPPLGLAIGSTIDNSGSIIGDNNDGIRLIGGGSVTNSGYIAGRVGAGADGISMFSFDGQDFTSFDVIGSVTNLAGGVIEGNRFGVIMSNGGIVDNAGTISGIGGSILLQAQEAGADLPRNGTVTNSGTLNGTVQFNNLANASVTNSGTISAPVGNGVYTTAPGGPLTVNNQAPGSITGAASGIRSDGTSTTLVNTGTISGLGTDKSETAANGGVVLSGGPGSITNTGSISGTQFGIATISFTNPDNSITGLATNTTVNNSGSIIGQNNDGIRLHGGTVTNSGYIAGRVGVGADGISILAFDGQDLSGLSSAGIGTVNNLAGGVIEGHREGVIISDGGTVNNAGTINGGTRGAIVLEARDAGRTGTLTNSGTINGIVDFIQLGNASLANSGVILAPAGAAVHGWSFDNYMGPLAITNDATGTIIGGTSGIFSEGASLSLINTGTIRGNGTSVTLRTADAGVLVTGGPAAITNSGGISGAGFGITTGTYSDFFTNAASSRAIGSSVTNTGSIIGDSNDGVRLIGGGTVANSGLISGRVGAGADGVSMFAFEDQVTTAQIGTVNNLLGGIIDGHRFGIIQSGGGTINNAGTINGGTNGAILIQTGFIGGKTGNLTNSGTINGSTTFFELANASVANTGTMSSNSTAAITSNLTNGPMSVNNGATGSITGATSGIVSAGSSLSVTNAGTIRGNGGYDGFDALPDGGVEVAGGPANIQNSGTISGQRFGITTSYVLNPNTNLLEGRAIGSTVSNSGNIIGDTDTGVRLIGGGTVTNSGYIAGRVGATADGVWMMAFNTQPLNSFTSIGSVTNLVGGVIEGNRRGVTLANGGSVNNAGTISGNSASIRIVAVAGDTGRTGSVTNTSTGTLNGSVELIGLANGSLTNSGSINGAASSNGAVYSDGPLAVTNASTGSITGSSYGIRAESSLTLNNAGTIIALAAPGSPDGFGVWGTGVSTITNSGHVTSSTNGITAFGLGSTVNNTGTVTTTAGSGVEVGGSLINSGAISSGVWGVEVQGGGSVTNSASGSISGGTVGAYFINNGSLNNAGTISVINNNAAVIMGAFGTGPAMVTNSGAINGSVQFNGSLTATLNNSGTIAARGSAVAVTSDSPTNLSNSGSISTTGSTAISLLGNNKADTVTLLTGSSITGAVDGGTGNDTLRLSGTVSTPTATQTVGRFLNFETFNVLGGYWTAPGNTGTFASTTLSGGALAVNGTLTSPVTVNAGAMLAGTGAITGAVTMNSGGMLAPGGSSLGSLGITGNVLFNAGSTFSVQTNPNGSSDKLAVTGAVTINKGATIQVLAGIFANYAPLGTSYVVLTATGGISGKFDTITTDYAYFKATVNTQQKGTITVQIIPNGKPLPSAATATTFSTAASVQSLGTSSALYQSVLYQSLTGARQAFSSLSGSGYGRLDALMADDVGNMRLGLGGSSSTAPEVDWTGVNSLGSRGVRTGSLTRRGQVSLMMIGGRYGTRLSNSSIVADIDTRFLGTAVGYRSGRFQAMAGVTSAWHDVAATRTISFPGFIDHASSRYLAQSHRVDVESSYTLSRGKVGIAPYAGYSRLMTRSQAFGESGGYSALSFERGNSSVDQLRLGIRMQGKLAVGRVMIAPHLDASVERSWGDLQGSRMASFAGSNEFESLGSAFNRRAAAVDAGVDVKAGRVTLTGSYRGRIGDSWSDHSAVVQAAVRF